MSQITYKIDLERYTADELKFLYMHGHITKAEYDHEYQVRCKSQVNYEVFV